MPAMNDGATVDARNVILHPPGGLPSWATFHNSCERRKKVCSRSLCVYLVVRENLLHLFIHCDCNAKLHFILVLSSEVQAKAKARHCL